MSDHEFWPRLRSRPRPGRVAHATAALSLSMSGHWRFYAWTPPRNHGRFLPPFCRAQCSGISGRCVHPSPFMEGACRLSNRVPVESSWSGTSRGWIARRTKPCLPMPKFIGEPTDYVLNQVIDTVLGKDKDFQGWRTEHGESFVPRPGSKSHRSRRAAERQPANERNNADLAAVGSARG